MTLLYHPDSQHTFASDVAVLSAVHFTVSTKSLHNKGIYLSVKTLYPLFTRDEHAEQNTRI